MLWMILWLSLIAARSAELNGLADLLLETLGDCEAE